MQRFFISLALAALAACAAPDTATQPEPQSAQHEAAKAVFDQALSAYQGKDYAAALPLFREAAAQGFFKADRYIGLMYLNGEVWIKTRSKPLPPSAAHQRKTLPANTGSAIATKTASARRKIWRRLCTGIKNPHNAATMFRNRPLMR